MILIETLPLLIALGASACIFNMLNISFMENLIINSITAFYCVSLNYTSICFHKIFPIEEMEDGFGHDGLLGDLYAASSVVPLCLAIIITAPVVGPFYAIYSLVKDCTEDDDWGYDDFPVEQDEQHQREDDWLPGEDWFYT